MEIRVAHAASSNFHQDLSFSEQRLFHLLDREGLSKVAQHSSFHRYSNAASSC
jgi:hypothetical protein